LAALTLDIEFDLINEFITTRSEKSLNNIIKTYKKFVYATALRYIENYDDADDITQEVFIKVYNNLDKFKGNSSFKTWLYRITVNLSINFLRKKKIFRFFSLDNKEINENFQIDFSTPDKVLEDKEFNTKFLSIIAKLPEKQRETFALRYYEEMPYEEISKLLGTSVGGLKANYHQAVKKITNMLKSSDLQEVNYEK